VLTRFIDMGMQPYQVAATVKLCIAQRLVRRLCQQCRNPRDLTSAEAMVIRRPASAGQKIYEAKGCSACGGRGFKGRLGVFELMPIGDELGRMIVEGSDEGKIDKKARELGIPSISDDAAEKLLAGLTSYGELVGVSVW
jgi:type II secretory ATPase GspE/PulE/Tfp pilus assembly ATPase PilB-like protein